MSVWKVGTRVSASVYDGERLVCECISPEDADKIVKAVNDYETLRIELSEANKTLEYAYMGDCADILCTEWIAEMKAKAREYHDKLPK